MREDRCMPSRRSILAAALSAAATAAIVAAISVAASLSFGLVEARADSGVPIPAEASSEWEIVAGYNTFSHSEADNEDPHAIDLVRLDSQSGGSAVLSPTTGTVSYSSNDCLSIRDAAGMEHLLCHIQPTAGLYRGTDVAIGERVGTVWHAGYGNNGGLAHIHYAVHHSAGGGYLGRTVPFTGAYRIEGRELFYDTSYNQHAGARFISTNRPGWQGAEPADSAAGDSEDESSEQVDDSEDDPESEPTTAAATPERRPVSTVTGGWRSFAVEYDTTIGAVWSRHGATLTSLFTWDRQTPELAQLPPRHTRQRSGRAGRTHARRRDPREGPGRRRLAAARTQRPDTTQPRARGGLESGLLARPRRAPERCPRRPQLGHQCVPLGQRAAALPPMASRRPRLHQHPRDRQHRRRDLDQARTPGDLDAGSLAMFRTGRSASPPASRVKERIHAPRREDAGIPLSPRFAGKERIHAPRGEDAGIPLSPRATRGEMPQAEGGRPVAERASPPLSLISPRSAEGEPSRASLAVALAPPPESALPIPPAYANGPAEAGPFGRPPGPKP